jgi:hypothetical protein
MFDLAQWLSPLAVEHVRFSVAMTATVLALAFVAFIVCMA